jgi:hypothetical protein
MIYMFASKGVLQQLVYSGPTWRFKKADRRPLYVRTLQRSFAYSSKQLQEVLIPALQLEWTVSNDIRIVNVLYVGNHKPVQIKYVGGARSGIEDPVAYHWQTTCGTVAMAYVP